MAKGITVAKLDAQLAALEEKSKAGAVNAKDYAEQKGQLSAMRKYVAEQPTRESGSTEESVREFAKLAKLNPAGMAEVDSIMKTLDTGVARLRELIGKVDVTVEEGKSKGKHGNPRPRWFCNVVVKESKEESAAPAPAPATDESAAPATVGAAPGAAPAPAKGGKGGKGK